MSRGGKNRQPLETDQYLERWLFGAEAVEWLKSHPASIDNFNYKRAFTRRAQLGFAVDDGWGIVVSSWKKRPDDQSSYRVICPRCRHELRANQRAWMFRHERKCCLPTRVAMAGWLADAFNVFSVPPGFEKFDVVVATWVCRAFKVLTRKVQP